MLIAMTVFVESLMLVGRKMWSLHGRKLGKILGRQIIHLAWSGDVELQLISMGFASWQPYCTAL